MSKTSATILRRGRTHWKMPMMTPIGAKQRQSVLQTAPPPPLALEKRVLMLGEVSPFQRSQDKYNKGPRQAIYGVNEAWLGLSGSLADVWCSHAIY